MRFKPAILLAALLMVSACQSVEDYTPLIDRFLLPEGRSLMSDVDQCREYGARRDYSEFILTNTVFGGIFGATLGALAGTLFNSIGWGAGFGAAYGAAIGYATGTGEGFALQQEVVMRCLKGRGYSILAP